MTLRHSVLIVTHPTGVEFHLDHRVGPGRGQHRVVGEAGFAAWIADVGEPLPSFRVAAACPCQRPAGVVSESVRREPVRAPGPVPAASTMILSGPTGPGG
jgi:hypothetical protein